MSKEGFIPTTENIIPKEVAQTPYGRRTAFLEQAIAEGSLDKLPNKSITANQWNRIVDIGLLYCLNEDLTQQDLAASYGLKKGERIRQIVKKFIVDIWNNCSDELKNKYPLTTIPYDKPLSQKSRERRFEAHGGRRLRIKRATEEQGITEVRVEDIDDIADAAGITRQQLLASRPALEKLGISIHRVDASDADYADFAEKLRKEEDDEKLQEFLDSLSAGSLIYFLHKDSSHKTLTTVSVIARKKGFRFHNKQVRSIAEKIQTAGIPIIQTVRLDKDGKLLGTYYIVCAKRRSRIAKALRNDPSLQRFR